MSETQVQAGPAPARDADPLTVRALRAGGALVIVLAGLGALLGFVWAAWSPPGPRALVVSRGVFIPDETEAFVAGDGRFLVIGAVVGLLAGFAAWRLRQVRGPLLVLALLVGGLAGSLLQELTGHLTGGGSFAGKPNTLIGQLPLSLHAQGLLLVEPLLAVLVYGLLAAFAKPDDLGCPDPVHDRLTRRPTVPDVVGWPAGGSVDAGRDAQHGWGDGDAARAPQQGDLPPQQGPYPY